MNKPLALIALILSAAAVQAAGPQEEATVISSRPLIRQFQAPQQVCTSATACSTQMVIQSVQVYDVEYEYAGQRYRVELQEAPGRTIPVNVAPVMATSPHVYDAPPPVTTITYTRQPAIVTPIVVTSPVYVATYTPYYAGYPHMYYPPIRVRLGIGYYRGYHR